MTSESSTDMEVSQNRGTPSSLDAFFHGKSLFHPWMMVPGVPLWRNGNLQVATSSWNPVPLTLQPSNQRPRQVLAQPMAEGSEGSDASHGIPWEAGAPGGNYGPRAMKSWDLMRFSWDVQSFSRRSCWLMLTIITIIVIMIVIITLPVAITYHWQCFHIAGHDAGRPGDLWSHRLSILHLADGHRAKSRRTQDWLGGLDLWVFEISCFFSKNVTRWWFFMGFNRLRKWMW